MKVKKERVASFFILTLLVILTLACILIWLTTYITSWGSKWSWLFNCLIPVLTIACGFFVHICTKKTVVPVALWGLIIFVTSFLFSVDAYLKRDSGYGGLVLIYIVFVLLCVISLMFSLNLSWIFAKGSLLCYTVRTVFNTCDKKCIRKIRLLLWISPIAALAEMGIIVLQILLAGFALAFFDYILAFVAVILYWEMAFLFCFACVSCFIYGATSYKITVRKFFFVVFVIVFALMESILMARNTIWLFTTFVVLFGVNFFFGFLGYTICKKRDNHRNTGTDFNKISDMCS